MKIVRYERQKQRGYGILQGERVHQISSLFDFEHVGEASFSLSECRLLAPCEPSKIVCAGKNYYDHALEMGEDVPKMPILFVKTPNTVANPEDLISAPSFVDRVDYEGELAFVIGCEAKNISPTDWRNYILGYTILNDVTARTIQKSDGQWTRGKCMDGFCPMGPWIETELDPSDLAIETRLNGVVKQQGRTSQLMTDIPKLLSYITSSMTLVPGDVVATGTPAGIGPMQSGDLVEVEIEKIGILKNRMQ